MLHIPQPIADGLSGNELHDCVEVTAQRRSLVTLIDAVVYSRGPLVGLVQLLLYFVPLVA